MVYFREEEGLQFLRTVLLYIEKGSGLNKKDIKQAMDTVDPLIREEHMTLYEQHIQEGIEDADILEKGLDEFVFAETKKQVLDALR